MQLQCVQAITGLATSQSRLALKRASVAYGQGRGNLEKGGGSSKGQRMTLWQSNL